MPYQFEMQDRAQDLKVAQARTAPRPKRREISTHVSSSRADRSSKRLLSCYGSADTVHSEVRAVGAPGTRGARSSPAPEQNSKPRAGPRGAHPWITSRRLAFERANNLRGKRKVPTIDLTAPWPPSDASSTSCSGARDPCSSFSDDGRTMSLPAHQRQSSNLAAFQVERTGWQCLRHTRLRAYPLHIIPARCELYALRACYDKLYLASPFNDCREDARADLTACPLLPCSSLRPLCSRT